MLQCVGWGVIKQCSVCISVSWHFDWCCTYNFIRNSRVALLKAPFARIDSSTRRQICDLARGIVVILNAQEKPREKDFWNKIITTCRNSSGVWSQSLISLSRGTSHYISYPYVEDYFNRSSVTGKKREGGVFQKRHSVCIHVFMYVFMHVCLS